MSISSWCWCRANAGHTDPCLPGAGFTFDERWNCGLIHTGQFCYSPGNCLGASCAARHTYGWGSADYDGGGSAFVTVGPFCVESFCGSEDSFFGSDWGLVRACRFGTCVDQNYGRFVMYVQWSSSGSTTARHTILGHGKA